MSAPAVIDALEFARGGQRLQGSLAVESLARLEDLLLDTGGRIEYELSGGRDTRNRPQLELKVAGKLHLQCQRCLGLLAFELAVDNTLLVAAPGTVPSAELDDPEGPDVIEAEAALDVAGLVEDEVLLALPLAPRHPEGDCARLEQHEEAARAPAAFAQLAALKPHG